MRKRVNSAVEAGGCLAGDGRAVGGKRGSLFCKVAGPLEHDVFDDVRVKALMNRAAEGGGFQCGSLGMVGWQWQPESRDQPDDSPRLVLTHVFFHLGGGVSQINSAALSNDGHGREQAGAEGSRHQIGGRERFAPSTVVTRRIGCNFTAARTMDGATVQFTLIDDRTGDHESYFFASTMRKPPTESWKFELTTLRKELSRICF
jgi:hypothetical protein